jgi:hypothetical protein
VLATVETRRTIVRRLSAALAVFAVLAVSLPPSSPAQDAKLDVKSADTIKSVLEAQRGKRVSVVLNNGGQEITGVVSTVGDSVVHLSELSGRDFFDAVVTLDRISAVIVKVRGR